jgi:hypothetical protein
VRQHHDVGLVPHQALGPGDVGQHDMVVDGRGQPGA